MKEIRFDGKVVLVTGAGGGLGRAYALEFAKRGAVVVVNDFETINSDSGTQSKTADRVVEEIENLGGKAVANYDSVENGDRIVKTAIDTFGRIDVVINNAGILRDISFAKMTDENWQSVHNVHVFGAYKVTKSAWSHMLEQGFGRVIFTSSAAGIYGNFGQANYSSAKSALIGLGRTLALEGQRKNILTNIIAPSAGSRMTETILPKEVLDRLSPELVVPLVVKLCAENSEENGSLFEVGGGWFTKIRYQKTKGLALDPKAGITAEDVANNWDSVCDFTDATVPESLVDGFNDLSKHIGIDMLSALK